MYNLQQLEIARIRLYEIRCDLKEVFDQLHKIHWLLRLVTAILSAKPGGGGFSKMPTFANLIYDGQKEKKMEKALLIWELV